MRRYDPLRGPKPEIWLQLDESEQIEAVEKYHRRANIALPNMRVHALMHVIVETQIAKNDPIEVRQTLDRLRRQMDRHDAIHAIGCVLSEYLYSALTTPHGKEFDLAGYRAALGKLTRESWYRDYQEDTK